MTLPFNASSFPLAPLGEHRKQRLRIAIITFELVGFWKNGGIGTVSTGLAELLAKAGHDVTVAFTRADLLDARQFESASKRYKDQGIKVVALRRGDMPPVSGPLEGFTGWERYAAYQFLKREHFDIVHASEHLGELFYALAAKRLGLAFANTQFWVGCHGPSHWVIEANDDVVRDDFWLWTDASERFCLSHADVVWAPSRYLLEWMEQEGYVLPEGRTYQQIYHIPDDLSELRERARPPRGSRSAVSEVVFFGRLETRKGIKLFLSAVAAMAPELADVRVSFMGRIGMIDGEPADKLIARSMARLDIDWQILPEFDRAEAYAYVTQPGRLVVAAAPVDNSPCAIYELLELEAHFIACRGGGVPELISPNSHDDVLFDFSISAIVERLRFCLENGSIAPAPAMSRSDVEAAWVAAHDGLVPVSAAAPSEENEPVVAVIAYDGDPELLAVSMNAVRSCGPRVSRVLVVQSDRRGLLPVDFDGESLAFDEIGHAGVLRELANIGSHVLVLRAGTVITAPDLEVVARAARRADAVVPFARVMETVGAPTIALALTGTVAWAIQHGTARYGGIISASAIRRLSTVSVPGSDILLWFDAALAEGLEVLPLADPLLDGCAVRSNSHHASDERARLNFWMTRSPAPLRLLLERAYGFMQRPPTPATNSETLGKPSKKSGTPMASKRLLRSTAWELGGPVRLVSRLLRRR